MVTWNPRRRNPRRTSAFCESNDPPYKVAELNWRDNPMFPAKLDRDRLQDRTALDMYDHVWEGGYVFWRSPARTSRANCPTPARPGESGSFLLIRNLPVQAFADPRATGSARDNFRVLVSQFVSRRFACSITTRRQGCRDIGTLPWMRERLARPFGNDLAAARRRHRPCHRRVIQGQL